MRQSQELTCLVVCSKDTPIDAHANKNALRLEAARTRASSSPPAPAPFSPIAAPDAPRRFSKRGKGRWRAPCADCREAGRCARCFRVACFSTISKYLRCDMCDH